MDSKSESDLLFKIIEEKYGAKLSEGQLAKVKAGVEKLVETAGVLRKVKLDYTVEPFMAFKPYRKEE